MTVKVAHTIEELRAVVTVPGTILVNSKGLAYQYQPKRFWGHWLEVGDERPCSDDEMGLLFNWPATVVWEPLPEQFTIRVDTDAKETP